MLNYVTLPLLHYSELINLLYFFNILVVRAETLRFKEEGVRDILKDVFLPWYNAYRFLMQVKRVNGCFHNYSLDRDSP